MVISNELYIIHAEAKPIVQPPENPGAPPAQEPSSGPCLRLLMRTGAGSGHFSGAKGLHGLLYMAGDWKTPAIAITNRVDILSSEDNSKIVVMIAENGPIYSSTNSGMTWLVVSAPGYYKFPLTGDERSGGYIAAGTIHPSPQQQTSQSLPPANWYAVGLANDGNKLVLTKNGAQGTPVLKIIRSNNGATVSWQNVFGDFVLQANVDLTSTNWTDVAFPVKAVADESQVCIPSPISNTFFRLRSK